MNFLHTPITPMDMNALAMLGMRREPDAVFIPKYHTIQNYRQQKRAAKKRKNKAMLKRRNKSK